MNNDLLADLWTVLIEHIPEKHRGDSAAEYVNTLLDHGVKESVITDMLGIDAHLDTAINYAIDGEEIDSIAEEDNDYYNEDYED